MSDGDHISVKAGSYPYPIILSNYKAQLSRVTGSSGRAALISNPTVFALHGRECIRRMLPARLEIIPIMMGDGERYKNQRTINRLYDHLFDIRFGRGDTIIAFGGGVVGDTAGMAAATFMRGVPLIQIPTTLLAMVDSSIGGKVGINHRLGKNLVGAFHQPRAVAVNPIWLATLGRRELVEGLAEIIKAGFLSSKRLLAAAVEIGTDIFPKKKDGLFALIREAAAFKARIVARDINDQGIRAILNFGHTFGHALEKAEGPRRYRHGEAVLAGMIGALYLSQAAGQMSRADMTRCLDLLSGYVGYLSPLKMDAEDYLSPMSVDKKSNNGRLRFVLLEKIGRPAVRTITSRRMVLEAIEFMKDFINTRTRK